MNKSIHPYESDLTYSTIDNTGYSQSQLKRSKGSFNKLPGLSDKRSFNVRAGYMSTAGSVSTLKEDPKQRRETQDYFDDRYIKNA